MGGAGSALCFDQLHSEIEEHRKDYLSSSNTEAESVDSHSEGSRGGTMQYLKVFQLEIPYAVTFAIYEVAYYICCQADRQEIFKIMKILRRCCH